MTELHGKGSPATRHGCASCAVPRSVVEPKRKAAVRDEASETVLLLFGGEQGKKPSLKLFSDVWMFDPDTLDCSYLGEAPASFTKRSYFTATYVDGAVWIVGGKTDNDIVKGDTVWKYDVRGHSWEQVELEGDGGGRLTRRTAHGACVSPWDARTIVIFGGYSVRDQRGAWLSDVFEIDTRVDRGNLTRSPRISFEKLYDEKFARAYMTLDAIDGICVVLFGRKGSQTVRDPCLVYDKKRDLKVIKATSKPAPRYNHRTSACSEGVLLACGGDSDGTLALIRYDARRKALDLETLPVGVRKSHGQLIDRTRQRDTDESWEEISENIRLSLVGGYDLGAGETEVDQVELTDATTKGRARVVRTKTHEVRKLKIEVGALRKLLADRDTKEEELGNKARALEEARQALEEHKALVAALEKDLEQQRGENRRIGRLLEEKTHELDAMAAACGDERSRVEEKVRELEQLEQERDMQALRFNSELERVHTEYKADLRKKDEQMRDMERDAATAAEAIQARLEKMQWDWEAERVERHVQHVKELNDRAARVEQLIREKKELAKSLEERTKEVEAAKAEAAARLQELRDAHGKETADLNRRIEKGKEALARKDRECEDEKSRVRAALAKISADLTKVQP